MSGDSLSLSLSVSRVAADSSETTTLFEELRKPLLRYLSGLGLPPQEAQDVVQDSFLALHKHLAAGGSQANIRSWIFRVAHNRARNHQSSYAQRMAGPLDPALNTAAKTASPEQALLDSERLDRLEAAIRALAPQEHQCLMLRAEGLRYREIGEVLAMSTSTVADTVERAIRKLAEKCNV